MRFRWETVHEWLAEYVEEIGETKLRWVIQQMAEKLDADTLQNLFEPEMDEMGYFEELDEYGLPIDDDDDDDEEELWEDG